MTDERLEALMHAVLEGTATSDDRNRLDAPLAADSALRSRFAGLQRAHELLRSAPRMTAPPELFSSVMSAVRQDEASRTREGRTLLNPFESVWGLLTAPLSSGGRNMKKVLLGVGALAVVGIIYFGVYGDTTKTTTGVEGTIGVANRYQESQITSEDVVLDDQSINDVLQTELFHELVTNPDFRKLVTSDAFQKVVSSDAFKGYIADPEVQKAYAAIEAHRGAVKADNGKSALADDAVQKLVSSSPEFQRLLSTDGFGRFLSNPVVQGRLTSVDGARSLLMAKEVAADADLAKLIAADPEFGKIVASADFQKLVEKDVDALGKFTADGDFARLVSRPEVSRLFASEAFNKLLAASPEAGRTLISPELGRLVASSDVFRNAFLNSDYGKLVSRPEFQKLATKSEADRRLINQ